MPEEGSKNAAARGLDKFISDCRETVFLHIKNYLGRASDGLPPRMKRCVFDYPYRRGKALRPAMLALFCGACGGRPAGAMRLAAAYQLLEDWGLGRDDLLDGAVLRRGKPALQRLYGAAVTVNALDMLHVFVFDMLASYCSLTPRLYSEARDLFTRASVVTLGGQHLDIEARSIPLSRFTPRAYYRIAARKTAFYTVTAPCLLGLAAAGKGPEEKDILAYGEALGTAFQIIDDVLDAENDGSGSFGKMPGNDIMEGKRTLVAVEAWRRMTGRARRRLSDFYSMPAGSRDPRAADSLRRGMLASGAADACRARAEELTTRAQSILERRLLPRMSGPHARMLREFSRLLEQRKA